MLSSVQISARLRSPRWRPLADIDCVKWALDVSAEDIEQLIDLAYLVVFDIAVRTDGRGGIIAPRRELRFLTRSIEHYRLTLGSRRLELSWTEMFGLIVPPDKASLTGIEVDSVLNCDPNHRLNLIRARELLPAGSKREAGETGWCRGRNCGASVTRVSVEKFLRKRQL
jgi:hypothetical protein